MRRWVGDDGWAALASYELQQGGGKSSVLVPGLKSDLLVLRKQPDPFLQSESRLIITIRNENWLFFVFRWQCSHLAIWLWHPAPSHLQPRHMQPLEHAGKHDLSTLLAELTHSHVWFSFCHLSSSSMRKWLLISVDLGLVLEVSESFFSLSLS